MKMHKMQAEKARVAFERAFGKAEVVRIIPLTTEPAIFSIAVPGDEFSVQLIDGRIIWHDFTHSTDLGPEDGSEIAQKLVAR